MAKVKLEFIVFISGGLVMVLEIVGSRILAPYLGTSLFIWTSIIGIILAALSLGYYLGGRISDKYPNIKVFSLILFLAGIAIGLTTISKTYLLEFIQENFNDLRFSSVFAATVLFAPASVLLGMVSPYAIRLRMEDVKHSGATVGKLSAISTVGSITGTFLAGFTLIPLLGSTNILYFLSLTLFLLSILAYSSRFPVIKIGIIIIFISLFYTNENLLAATYPPGFVDVDTQYNRVQIYEGTRGNRPVKYMSLNRSNSSAMYTDSDELVFAYSKFYRLAEHFNPDFKNALVVGGAAYSYPKYFIQNYPDAELDVVEIDPQLTDLAKEHFNLKDDPRLHIYHEDGRTFLKNPDKKYDVIYGDAYKAFYSMPFHLATEEAFQEVSNSLADDGVFLLNIITSLEGEKSDLFRAVHHTLSVVFPQVYVFPVFNAQNGDLTQNLIIVALKSEETPSFTNADPELNQYLNNLYTKEIPHDLPLLTDEFAPTDNYVLNMINEVGV